MVVDFSHASIQPSSIAENQGNGAQLFDEFFIDLTDIGSGSKAEPDKEELITQFENMLNGDENAQQNLHKMVELSTRNQYRKGL
jgi:putative protease